MRTHAQLMVKLVEVDNFLAQPNFKEDHTNYLRLRKWLAGFATDQSQSEKDRNEAMLQTERLVFAFHAVVGAPKPEMSKGIQHYHCEDGSTVSINRTNKNEFSWMRFPAKAKELLAGFKGVNFRGSKS